MKTIRELFSQEQGLDRRIEKVITYARDGDRELRQEVTEYIVTPHIESQLDSLLDHMDRGFQGGGGEIGVWVSGFYGSGKSSFTKYLGFAFDPSRQVEGKPFREYLLNQIQSQPVRQHLATVTVRHSAEVIMIDLASEQIAGATMAEISTVLWWKVLQWAGYPRDRKTAHLQLMLEKDGKMADFEKRILELSGGTAWGSLQNQPLAANQFASQLAAEFYPNIYKSSDAFHRQKLDEVIGEDDRVREMLDLIRRKSGKDNVVFILDEVGQYVAARENLILNLDGLAKNLKNIGGGHAWLIATAQQRLLEDNQAAMHNAASLFKLRDRFPIDVTLEASDIETICHKRLLTKSSAGFTTTAALFDASGEAMRHHTKLSETKFYKCDVERDRFAELYPLLPQHLTLLMEILGRLSKGRITGLRSTLKVVQDILVDQSKVSGSRPLLADAPLGNLATLDRIFDTLRRDIQTVFRHLEDAVRKAEACFGADSMEARAAKAVACLQILDNLPSTETNVAALLHPTVSASSLAESVALAVRKLKDEPAVPLAELDGRLRFMSEAVGEMETARSQITVRGIDARAEFNKLLGNLFAPLPNTTLGGVRKVAVELKISHGGSPQSLNGSGNPIGLIVEFVAPSRYDQRRDDLLTESSHASKRTDVCLIAREDPDVDRLVQEIVRCDQFWNQNKNNATDKEVAAYLEAQHQRAEKLRGEVEQRLKQSLLKGSFIFRGVPSPVSSHDAASPQAGACDHLSKFVAGQVFSKHGQAPVAADTKLAEQFLKVTNLALIPGDSDPLELVATRGGGKNINLAHPALVSIRDYLERNGLVEGAKLQDDFFEPEFGWSKDTTRYLLAALLMAGEIRLRVGGQDITANGEIAQEALKNTNAFKKVGVALREIKLQPETLQRASERLLELTGDIVMPLENNINQAVTKSFPAFRDAYADLAVRIKALGLAGVSRAENLIPTLRDLLAADASSAAGILGAETCALAQDLVWARKARQALDHGLETDVPELRRYLEAIAELPEADVPGKLKLDTQDIRRQALDLLSREDFHACGAEIRRLLQEITGAVVSAAQAFSKIQSDRISTEIARLQQGDIWVGLDQETSQVLVQRLESLRITTSDDLDGFRKRLSHEFTIQSMLRDVEEAAARMAAEEEAASEEDAKEEETTRDFLLVESISSVADLDLLIGQLQTFRSALRTHRRVKIRWNRPTGGSSSYDA